MIRSGLNVLWNDPKFVRWREWHGVPTMVLSGVVTVFIGLVVLDQYEEVGVDHYVELAVMNEHCNAKELFKEYVADGSFDNGDFGDLKDRCGEEIKAKWND